MTKTEDAFLKKGLDNDYKIRRFFPNKYLDFSHETGCFTGYAICIGTMLSCQNMTAASGTTYILIRIKDRITGETFKVCIFNQPFAFKTYATYLGKQVLVAGDMKYDYGSYQIAGPAILTDDIQNNMHIQPVYPRLGNTKPFFVKKRIHEASLEKEEDTLPDDIRKSFNLPGISWSIYEMHHPSSFQLYQKAEERLLYDDLFYFAACNELSERKTKQDGIILNNADLCETIIQNFGYPLTQDQEKVFVNLSSKLKSGKRVRALVQGDVGCGKTIVAFLLAAQAAGSDAQALIMAPTKILATQHYEKLMKLLPDYADQMYLAAGGTVKKTDITKIKNGTYKFVIGTHALLSEKLTYEHAGIVIIDEEHKFGVEQRQKLENLSKDLHCVSMSATPIPRTLASALYGKNTEVYSIKSMPAGRQPVATYYDDGKRAEQCIRIALQRKEQVYIVCPAIELDEEKMPGVLSVKDVYTQYSQSIPEGRFAMLNGKMSATETEKTIKAFQDHEIDVLVSTTVVEVGVDVPNATLIIIQNAERFGLAGMHQLRGRVGRGNKPSCCLLISANNNERIQALCDTTDGFKIAERDLELRKSGILFNNKTFGTAQSGFNVITEEVMNNSDIYEHLRDMVAACSVPSLKKHISKIEMAHNPKRRRVYSIEDSL